MKPRCRFSATMVVIGVAWWTGPSPGMAGEPPVKRDKSGATASRAGSHSRSRIVKNTIRSARAALSRASAAKDPNRRAQKLRQVTQMLAGSIQRNQHDRDLASELLMLQAKAYVRLNDDTSAKAVVRNQQSAAKQARGQVGFSAWLSRQIDRLHNQAEFDLCIFHLQLALASADATQVAAEQDLLLGDMFMKRAYPDGPFDDAINHYEKVATRFLGRFPDIAEAASLRQAKTLWRNGQPAEAKTIFDTLANSKIGAIAEEARHFPDIMELNADRPPTADNGG